MSKFPTLEKLNLLFYRGDEVFLKEEKFFEKLEPQDFFDYELESSYPKVKLEEVERFLAKKY